MSFRTADYDFVLPPERIALRPAEPRDAARLLVVDRRDGSITHTDFTRFFDFLPKEAAVILNDTKVIKARIYGRKESGGAVELLLAKPLPGNRFLVNIRGKMKEGSRLFFDENLEAEVERLEEDGGRVVRFFRNGEELDFDALQKVLDAIGHVPLPPYIKRDDTLQDREDYQTVFAANAGSVAAPTASLHFTDAMFGRLRAEHDAAFVTLHVGLGTFKGVEAEDIREHPMHSEWFRVGEEAEKIIRSDRLLLAVGTTAGRTVEYAFRTGKREGECDLFLHPGNPPKRVNHLLTNFHLPKSTLIMLVASFLGLEKTLEVYETAVREKYRFYSYGDGMLIL